MAKGRKGSNSSPKQNAVAGKRVGRAAPSATARSYQHPEAQLSTRPEIGTQAQFRKKKPPKTYKYDPSLSPELSWDGQNPAREQGEALLGQILDASSLDEAKSAAEELRRMSRPFLNWTGKAERLSFDVPTLPLFVHERLSTKAILETLKRHRKDQQEVLDLFGDPQHSLTDQVLRAYEHRDRWVNRLILGDSLVVMNSLLEYEGLGGQVQMIYIDPPYGVKFGSNFQPFVRKRDVKHNDDGDMTREPEMVQAYRDTWELGLHSYLTYLRDRFLLARDLLTHSGSIFVQISDDNLHHVRELMDEVFGSGNQVGVITFQKTAGAGSPSIGTQVLASVGDYLLWYARDREQIKYRQLYLSRDNQPGNLGAYTWLEEIGGVRRRMSPEEMSGRQPFPNASRAFTPDNLTSQTGVESTQFPVVIDGKTFRPAKGGWKTNLAGMEALRKRNRLIAIGETLRYVRFADDFPVRSLSNLWTDTTVAGYSDPKTYVVQTNTKVLQRCVLMTTDPGDLVIDPTCGSGTTAYVAEQWGRRWITIDTSRVPLALTRQRILTATFPWYSLKDDSRGPAGGLAYERKLNNKGEEVGGIVPHVTLKSLANDEPPTEEVLVDRPAITKDITRVTGPFVVEATLPTPVDYQGDGVEDSTPLIAEDHSSFVQRMIEVLRRSPVLQVGGARTVTLRNVRPPATSLSLSAEAVVDGTAPGRRPSLAEAVDEAEERRGDRLSLTSKPVAIVFGPENGAVSDKLVYNAATEANAKRYTHLYVIGFTVQPSARELIERAEGALGVAATYVQATPDLMMGDLLKNLRSSQIFSVCGQPEIRVVQATKRDKSDPERYVVRLLGVDTFDPITMAVSSLEEKDIPAWFLDTDYDDLCFHVTQAFFPKTGAWEALRRDLKADYEESVWEHLNGLESAEFEASPETKIAVKVIDNRGNELMVVKTIAEALG